MKISWILHIFLPDCLVRERHCIYSQYFALKIIYLTNPETCKVCKQGSHGMLWFHFTLEPYLYPIRTGTVLPYLS